MKKLTWALKVILSLKWLLKKVLDEWSWSARWKPNPKYETWYLSLTPYFTKDKHTKEQQSTENKTKQIINNKSFTKCQVHGGIPIQYHTRYEKSKAHQQKEASPVETDFLIPWMYTHETESAAMCRGRGTANKK